MKELFFKVLGMSATASLVILAVLIARFFLRKAPKKYSYYLWAVVAFRLVCMFSFESVLSIFNFSSLRPQATSWNNRTTSIVHFVLPQPPLAGDVVDVSGVGAQGAPMAPAADWGQIAAGIWLAGIAVLMLYGIITYVLLRRKVMTAIPLYDGVSQADGIRSPFILGMIHPVIYVPYHLEKEALNYILLHEWYHQHRLDHVTRPLCFLILAVHWFNPLCWLAFYLSGRDMELSCDEAVLAEKNCERRAYSTVLLSVAAKRHLLSLAPLAFGETAVKDRIRNALHWKTPKRWVTVTAAALCIAVLLGCGLNPEDSPALQFMGEIAAVQREAGTGRPMLLVENPQGKKIPFVLDEKSFTISLIDTVDAEAYFQNPRAGDTVFVEYDRGRERVTAENGEIWKAYALYGIHLEKAFTRETAALADGTPIRIKADAFGSTVYTLADGTELLEVMHPADVLRVPNNSYREYVEERAQAAMEAYCTQQGLLYDERAELERAYQLYLEQPEAFQGGGCSIRQYTEVSWVSERLACLETELRYFQAGAGGPDAVRRAAFDRRTGELVPTEELFTVSPEELLETLLEENRIVYSEPELAESMRRAFRPEYIALYPTGLDIMFPPGTLLSTEYSDCGYGVGGEYSETVRAMIQPWAIPLDDPSL